MERSGSAVKSVIVPEVVNVMMSSPLPATHSPIAKPEAESVLAAVIASRRVHNPSAPSTTSAVLLTVMVLRAGGCRLVPAGDRIAAK